MNVEHGRAALLVVDMQNDFVTGPMSVPGAAALAARLAPLVAACRAAGVQVCYTVEAHRPDRADLGNLDRFYPLVGREALVEGTQGVEVVPELTPAPGDLVVVKRRFSGFIGTDLELALRAQSITQLFVCGVSTHVCCDTTARDAAQRDFQTWLVDGGTACGDLPDQGWGVVPAGTVHQAVFTLFAHRFGQVCSLDELLAALQGGQV